MKTDLSDSVNKSVKNVLPTINEPNGETDVEIGVQTNPVITDKNKSKKLQIESIKSNNTWLVSLTIAQF